MKRKRTNSYTYPCLGITRVYTAFWGIFLAALLSLPAYAQSIETLRTEIEQLRAANDQNKLNQKLVEAAFYYWDAQNTAEALALLEESARVSSEIGNQHGIANAYHNIGMIQAEQKQFSAAIENQKKAIGIKRQQGDQRLLATYLFNLGTTYMEANQPSEAIPTLQEGLGLAEKLNIGNLKTDSYLTLSQAYEKQNDKENALKYFKLYNEKYDEEGQQFVSELKDEYQSKEARLQAEKRAKERELSEKEKELQISELEKNRAEAEARASAQEVELLNKTKALQEAKLEAGRRILTFSIGIIVLIVIFGIFVVRANKRMKFANRKLELQKKAIMEQRDDISRKSEELHKAYENIQSSITYAERIQQASLPDRATIAQAFDDFFIFYKPRDVVSGDFYWFAQVRDSHTGDVKRIIAAVDCTGHGVPGAFMSLVGNSTLNQIVNERRITDPSIILSVLNERIIEMLKQETGKNQDGMDMALVCYDEKANTLEFSGAKNPFFFVHNDTLHTIKGSKKPIGGKAYQGSTYDKHTFVVDKPMTCYIFSDGYTDQFGEKDGSRFMTKRLKELITNNYHRPMKEQSVVFQEAFEQWKGAHRQIDDVLLIGFKISPKA